ncbi:hypothetical protein HBB16_07410 [Pseudonocardia sp. MCCB 268]|nr:hypothetical protein [Pseudonocardia cytotoxica]
MIGLPAVGGDDRRHRRRRSCWSPCAFLQGLACSFQWGGIVLLLTESVGPSGSGFCRHLLGRDGRAVPGLLLGN